MAKVTHKEIYKLAGKLSSKHELKNNEVAIILAAGHGKRIKSQKSKMLHRIWGIPTVQRVYNASKAGIKNLNTIIVVGIKADDVMETLGKNENNIFAYQEKQDGTGHAVQVALEKIKDKNFDGIVYVLPGDMGLIDKETMKSFRKSFLDSDSDMMVLTGIYEGDPAENSYGRIIRAKNEDENGLPTIDEGNVLQIMENKDIQALKADKPYRITYRGITYSYTKKELIANNEFNSGVYAFKYAKLKELIKNLSSNNVQKEIYITDLIELFNSKGYSVKAVSPAKPYVVMGFNNKSVLKEMENVARKLVYEQIKDIIEIEDPDDFYIHENVLNQIMRMDKKNIPLDINLGKGAVIDDGVKLNYGLHLMRNVFVSGNVHFGKNVTVWQSAHLTTFPGQTFKIGNSVEILRADILKGNITIGDNSRIESSVNMTGSDEYPVRIGRKVLIKGTSYVFGSRIGDGTHIEHSVLIKKKIGAGKKIRFYLPKPEGVEGISEVK